MIRPWTFCESNFFKCGLLFLFVLVLTPLFESIFLKIFFYLKWSFKYVPNYL